MDTTAHGPGGEEMTGTGLGGMMIPNHGTVGNGMRESGPGDTAAMTLGRVGVRVK